MANVKAAENVKAAAANVKADAANVRAANVETVELPHCAKCNGCEWLVEGSAYDDYATLQCVECYMPIDDATREALLAAFKKCNHGAHFWGPVEEEFGSMPGRTCTVCDLYNVDPNDHYYAESD